MERFIVNGKNIIETEIISLRSCPEKLELFCNYFSRHWGKPEMYRNCMENALNTNSPLPQWFLVCDSSEVIGGCGLITNDFISRMDLFPWLCALFVDERYRNQGLGSKLIEYSAQKASELGYENLYCCTDHTGYYEKCRFEYIGIGYHPWDETSRIYRRCLVKKQGSWL